MFYIMTMMMKRLAMEMVILKPPVMLSRVAIPISFVMVIIIILEFFF